MSSHRPDQAASAFPKNWTQLRKKFGYKRRKITDQSAAVKRQQQIDKLPVKIPLGLTMDGKELILSPYPYLTRLVVGGAGSAKTTSVVMPTIFALMANSNHLIFGNDPKDGEIYSQLQYLEDTLGIPVYAIDDFHEYGEDNPNRLNISPLAAVVDAYKNNPKKLFFTILKATHNIIPEVDDGGRNKWSRDGPRDQLHLFIRALVESNPAICTTGHLYESMADPETSRLVREVAARTGSPALQARAKQSLEQEDNEPVEYHKYLKSALQALQMYESGSILNEAGDEETTNYRTIIDQESDRPEIICSVLPQRYAMECGIHYSLHQQGIMEAQMSGNRKKHLFNIIDEATNSPQKNTIKSVTYARAFNVTNTFIVQSLADLENVVGKKETAVLLDNTPVVQYLSFTSYSEAEKVSRAWGEELTLNRSLNMNEQRLEVSGSMSLSRQRKATADELMNMPDDMQVIYDKFNGYRFSKKLFQNQYVPQAHHLRANRLEGDPMPVDPKVDTSGWFDWNHK